ncbi:MAG: right-handed parallel beta-helix repeat-containing protein [Pirellulaceae bacterium]|nr:right-handed parallel beta-helix repeat-containing protein [Pirellulaceae bacterium]
MRDVLKVMIVGVVLVPVAEARDLYVNNLTGDDRASGAAPRVVSEGNGPVRTIQRALRYAEFGDRIVLANTGEPYREQVSVQGARNSGSSQSPFIIEGNGATLDGTARIAADLWQPAGTGLLRYRPPRISFQRLFLNGRPLAAQSIDRKGRLASLAPGQWCMFQQSIHYRPESDVPLNEQDLGVSLHSMGITLYNVRHVVVRNLFIQGFRLDGVNALDNSFDCRLDTLTCRWNGRSGISVGGASRVKVQDCLLEDNGVAQLRTEGWSHVVATDCKFVGTNAWKMDGGRLSVDGKDQERKRTIPINVDSSPLDRP